MRKPELSASQRNPHHLDDLAARHVAVNCMSEQDGQVADLDFKVDGKPASVKVNGFFAVSDEHAYMTSGLGGLGLIQPARIAAQPFIESGQLQEVLEQWRPEPVSVVYVKGRHVSPRGRVFVDWFAELFERTEHFDADMSRADA